MGESKEEHMANLVMLAKAVLNSDTLVLVSTLTAIVTELVQRQCLPPWVDEAIECALHEGVLVEQMEQLMRGPSPGRN